MITRRKRGAIRFWAEVRIPLTRPGLVVGGHCDLGRLVAVVVGEVHAELRCGVGELDAGKPAGVVIVERSPWRNRYSSTALSSLAWLKCPRFGGTGLAPARGIRRTGETPVPMLPGFQQSNLRFDACEQCLHIVGLLSFNFPRLSIAISSLFPEQAGSQVAQGQRTGQGASFGKCQYQGTCPHRTWRALDAYLR